MKKHNRSLLTIFIFILFVLAIILYQSRQLFISETPLYREAPTISQEQMGVNEAQIPLLAIIKNMGECLQIPISTPNGLVANIESFLLVLQPALGPQNIKDKSMLWLLKGQNGQQKKLILTLALDEEGKPVKQLDFFSMDKDGVEVKIELDPEKTKNPTDEYLNSFLKDVEVLQKLKTSVAEFIGGGAVLQFEEHDGEMISFEMTKDKNTFRCDSLKSPESCQCVR